MPGSASSRRRGVVAIGAGIEVELAVGDRRGQPRRRLAPPGRASGSAASGASASVLGVGNTWVRPPSGAASGAPGGDHEPAGQRAGAGHRHLLAEDRPHRELEAVGGARHPPAGLLAHQRPRAAGRPRGARPRPPGRRRGRAAGGSGRPRRPGRAGRRAAGWRARASAAGSSSTVAGAVGQRQGAPVGRRRRPPRRRGRPAAPRNSTSPGPVERRAHGEAHRDRARACSTVGARPAPPQLGRRAGEHLPDGVVELADAGEARREGHVGERQVGRLDQQAGGLGPLGPGQRDRAGADLGGQLAVHVPLAVAEAARPARRRPRGRRRRRRSGAWPDRRGRPAGPTRATRAWRRAGSACRPGTRPPGRRPRWRRSARWPASA